MADKEFNPFKMAQEQFDKVADYLKLDQATRDLLRNPAREYHFSIPVRMDDGTFKIFSMHHHLLPVPNTGRERNIVNDAGDVLEVLVDSNVDLVLCGHKHVPYIWRIEDMLLITTGTVSSLRLRGKIEPNYNIMHIYDDKIDIYRRFPFDKVEKIENIKRTLIKERLNAEFTK